MFKKFLKFILVVFCLSVLTIAAVKAVDPVRGNMFTPLEALPLTGLLAQASNGVDDLGQFEPKGEGFGPPTCDRIVHIGQPLYDVANVLADVYDNYQKAASYVENTSKVLSGLYAQLSKDKQFVCDFSWCSALAIDAGPDFGLDVDLLLKQYSIDGHAALPNNKECQGSPCPNLGDENTGAIGALVAWRAAIDGSRGYVKAIFDNKNPTISVTEDIANGDLGERITRAEYIKRVADLGSRDVKACTLGEFEQKMVLSNRQAPKFLMTCEQALDMGAYWPFAWSRECNEQCSKEDNSEKCIECLKNSVPDPGTAKDIENINYKIYNKCKDKCYHQDSGDWYMDDACYACLCTISTPRKPVAGSGGLTGGPEVKLLSERQCRSWLCGGDPGSSNGIGNWVCCHYEPAEATAVYYETAMHHSEDLPWPEAATYGPTFTGGISGEGVEFVLTAYADPCFCEGRCTAKGSSVGKDIVAGNEVGTMAVFSSNIPYKSLVKITSDNFETAKFNATTKQYEHTGSTINSFSVGGKDIKSMAFCACDAGGDIKNGRIDVWMPSNSEARNFGVKFAKVQWQYNDDCCKPNKCCQKTNQMSAECQKYSGGESAGWRCGCDNETDCKTNYRGEWNDLFRKFSSISCESTEK